MLTNLQRQDIRDRLDKKQPIEEIIELYCFKHSTVRGVKRRDIKINGIEMIKEIILIASDNIEIEQPSPGYKLIYEKAIGSKKIPYYQDEMMYGSDPSRIKHPTYDEIKYEMPYDVEPSSFKDLILTETL